VDRLTAGKRRASILAVHPGAFGDVILFGHLLSAIGGRVTLLAGGDKARLLKGLGVVAEAADIDSLPIHDVFADTPLEQCRLPKLLGSHDRLISCLGGGNPRAEARLAGMCGARDAAFLPVRPDEGFAGHLLDLWVDLLGLAPIATNPLPWEVPRRWLEQGRDSLAEIGLDPRRPYVVIHPGAGSPAKCWPLGRFMELAREISRTRRPRNGQYGIVLVVGPVEQDRRPAEEVEGIRRHFPVLVCPSLEGLAGALKGAAAFVGNDSGVAHLAAAVGTPTVALFGPTSPRHFAPRGRAVKTVSAVRMLDIPADMALSAVKAILRKAGDRE
jgi:hypothetical protein